MTTYYFKNLAGLHLDEKEKGTITSPRFELANHITAKTVQSGAVLGTLLVGPLVSAYNGNRDFNSIQNSAYTYGRKGATLGLALGIPVYLLGTMKLNRQGIWDRSYRIRFNRNQNFVDRMSILGMCAGVGLAHFAGNELCKGAIFGLTGGCLVAGIINTVF